MTETEKILRDLIALPSVNPAFLSPKDPQAGEQRVADFIAHTACKNGLDAQMQPALPGRCNVLVALAPTGKVKQRILLAPHLDTVGASPCSFDPRTKNGRIYGRGACDTKGSVAAMLAALLQLKQQTKRPAHTEIVFAGLIDEENAQSGSRALARSGFKANLAIVGEPTLLKIITAHKGSIWLHFETQGKAAHGSRPDLGKNAVHEMARVVDFIETHYAAGLRKTKHPILGNATISVGMVSGGTQPNIVPAQSWMRADRRTLPGETDKTVHTEILRLLRKHKLRARVSSVKQEPCYPLQTDPHLLLVKTFFQTTGQNSPCGADYFCDASVLAHAGIPSIVFGPGDIAQAHTSDEWISQTSLNNAVDLLLKFFQSLP